MRRYALLVLAAAVLGGAGAAPAQAKFRITLRVEPTPVWAKQPTRVLVRTGIVLPRKHGLRLNVVGPYYASTGNPFFEPRLQRTGPKTYTATFRFPRGGTWRLIVPNWGAPGSASPPPVDRKVRVRPAS
jgi:hypothetical protein